MSPWYTQERLFHIKYTVYPLPVTSTIWNNDHQTKNGQIWVVGFIKHYFKRHFTVDVPGVIKFDLLSRDYQL